MVGEKTVVDTVEIFEKKNIKKYLGELFLNELCELEKKFFKQSAYSYEQIEEMFESDSYNFYVAIQKKSNEVVGYLITYDSLDAFEIIKIFIYPTKRKFGLGTRLLEFFFENIKEKNIFLEVRESNEVAIRFYESRKFEKIAMRKKYYKDNDENALVMKLKI